MGRAEEICGDEADLLNDYAVYRWQVICAEQWAIAREQADRGYVQAAQSQEHCGYELPARARVVCEGEETGEVEMKIWLIEERRRGTWYPYGAEFFRDEDRCKSIAAARMLRHPESRFDAREYVRVGAEAKEILQMVAARFEHSNEDAHDVVAYLRKHFGATECGRR